MLVAISLDNWKRARHSPRVQAKAISYIASKVELVEMNLRLNLESRQEIMSTTAPFGDMSRQISTIV